MSLQLHCKRSKMFVRQVGDKKTEKVLCPRGATTSTPDWVKDTEGYRLGVLDQSILDLTPPKPLAAPEPEAELESADPEPDEQETAKKPAAPKKSPVPKGMQGASTVVETR